MITDDKFSTTQSLRNFYFKMTYRSLSRQRSSADGSDRESWLEGDETS